MLPTKSTRNNDNEERSSKVFNYYHLKKKKKSLGDFAFINIFHIDSVVFSEKKIVYAYNRKLRWIDVVRYYKMLLR